MTMTKQGNIEAHPEEKHPGHAPLPPLGWPNESRWVGPNCKSKVPPVVRTVITEEDMKPVDPLAQI
jgi:hypothetical protein